jgi:hypothetical protein
MQEALTISDKPKPTVGMRPAPPPPTEGKPGAPRPENVPPRSGLVHRPSRSQEEAMRARRAQGSSSGRPRPPNGELNIFADPESPRKSEDRQRRPRRNSESSVVGSGKPLDAEEEKKRQERRRRERRHREREAREAGKDGKPKSRKLDIIDQLDATSIYGTGRKYTLCDVHEQCLHKQSSTTMAHSTPATHTAIEPAASALPCKPFPRTL